MNGSRARRSTPGQGGRTGKPSPSSADGAVVTASTGRSWAAAASGSKIRGRSKMSSTVTAGILHPPTGADRCPGRAPAAICDVRTTLIERATFPLRPGPGRRAAHDGHYGPDDQDGQDGEDGGSVRQAPVPLARRGRDAGQYVVPR